MINGAGSNITLKQLSQNWLGLSQDYRPTAFWFWNSELDPDRMRHVIDAMAANGIRQFLIHPFHAMTVEYLSEEYFKRVRIALEMAKERGIGVWIYDEYGWPSGNAGGLVIREHPEHTGWYLRFQTDEQGNITATPTQSDRITDSSSGAPWTQNEVGYVDTLSVEAVKSFIDYTHGRYYEHCSDYFGDTILGFFTDEPVSMMDCDNHQGHQFGAIGLPWTPSFPAQFKERFGYDIEPLYTQLAGDGPSEIKRDYWALAKDLYYKAFYKQIGDWCVDHGVVFTGHAGEDWFLGQVRYSGSIYNCISEMGEPGIDYLGWGPEPEGKYTHEVLIPSIARHAGRERVMCEAYGISPLDLRLGAMLRRVQMFGLHGVDDIALMGILDSLDGIRKQNYWPPIFEEAPWWEFYPQYRDGSARTLSLTALGKRCARYAIMYPQNTLEQIDVMEGSIALWDPGSKMVMKLAEAAYQAGESFDYVFPEILDQGKGVDGKIVFPNAHYDAILAPSDIEFFPETAAQLDRMDGEGGPVMRWSIDDIAASIIATGYDYSDTLKVDRCGGDTDIRIYRFEFSDGMLFGFRNVSEEPGTVKLSSEKRISIWDSVTGSIIDSGNSLTREIAPHCTLMVTVTDEAIGAAPAEDQNLVPIESAWSPCTDRPNTARFTQIEFHHEKLGWLPATDTSVLEFGKSRYLTGIPREFHGETKIRMRGKFSCDSIPGSLGILFEPAHLESLTVNGKPIDISKPIPSMVWDRSTAFVDTNDAAVVGENVVEGLLAFEKFETSLHNHTFHCDDPMPTCDVCVAGDFRFVDGKVLDNSGSLDLPIDLGKQGWEQYDGVLTLDGSVEVSAELADRVTGISVELASEDCLEVLIDGSSVGRAITWPYSFDLIGLAAGRHELTLRISSTSANILGEPSPWGAKSVSWVCSKQNAE